MYSSFEGLPPDRIVPTVGLNIGRIEASKTKLVFWDLGGQVCKLFYLIEFAIVQCGKLYLKLYSLQASLCNCGNYQWEISLLWYHIRYYKTTPPWTWDIYNLGKHRHKKSDALIGEMWNAKKAAVESSKLNYKYMDTCILGRNN